MKALHDVHNGNVAFDVPHAAEPLTLNDAWHRFRHCTCGARLVDQIPASLSASQVATSANDDFPNCTFVGILHCLPNGRRYVYQYGYCPLEHCTESAC